MATGNAGSRFYFILFMYLFILFVFMAVSMILGLRLRITGHGHLTEIYRILPRGKVRYTVLNILFILLSPGDFPYHLPKKLGIFYISLALPDDSRMWICEFLLMNIRSWHRSVFIKKLTHLYEVSDHMSWTRSLLYASLVRYKNVSLRIKNVSVSFKTSNNQLKCNFLREVEVSLINRVELNAYAALAGKTSFNN